MTEFPESIDEIDSTTLCSTLQVHVGVVRNTQTKQDQIGHHLAADTKAKLEQHNLNTTRLRQHTHGWSALNRQQVSRHDDAAPGTFSAHAGLRIFRRRTTVPSRGVKTPVA